MTVFLIWLLSISTVLADNTDNWVAPDSGMNNVQIGLTVGAGLGPENTSQGGFFDNAFGIIFEKVNKIKAHGYNAYGKSIEEKEDLTAKNQAIQNLRNYLKVINYGCSAMLVMVIAFILVIKFGKLGVVSQNVTKRAETSTTIMNLLFAIALIGGSGFFISIITMIALSFAF